MTDENRTTFTVVSRDEYLGPWPHSHTSIETRVDGDLADKVRARSGLDGVVLLHEEGQEGGWSEWTVEWDYIFSVTVGGQEVFAYDGYGPTIEEKGGLPTDGRIGGVGEFMLWLEDQ